MGKIKMAEIDYGGENGWKINILLLQHQLCDVVCPNIGFRCAKLKL